MNNNILKIVLSLVLISFLSVSLSKGEEGMSNDIDLIVESSKKIVSIGDEIEFIYTFLNNSQNSIYILPWGGEYVTNWIVAYDSDGNKLPDIPSVFYELKIIPQKEDFVLVESRKSYSIKIKGKIIKTKLSKFGKADQKKYKGMFLDFDNSAIFLNGTDNFTVKAFYEGREEWRKKGKELYNLDNIWSGKLESNEIKIVLKKKKTAGRDR